MRLKFSPLGDEITKETFVRTPLSVVKMLLVKVEDEEQRTANVASISQAYLADLVVHLAHGLSGASGPAPRVKPQDFLPYPDWKPSSVVATSPDDGTRFVLRELLRRGHLPSHVFTALMGSSVHDR